MNEQKRVLIAPSSFAELDPEPVNKLVVHDFEVVNNPFHRKLTTSELKDLLPEVTGLIAGLETIDREIMEAFDRLDRIGTPQHTYSGCFHKKLLR